MVVNWTKEQFEAYVLLYAAQSNNLETEEERDYILSKISEKCFNSIHTEIVHDSEYESIKKIQLFLIDNEYSLEDKEALKKDIKKVFFADGSVDMFERNVFLTLSEILK